MPQGASAARVRSVLIVKKLNRCTKRLSVLAYFWTDNAIFPYTGILAVFMKYMFKFVLNAATLVRH